MKKILPKIFYPFLILLLVGVLSWNNYVPGTFLTGWDNLHPEFNFSLYLKRAFFGAWQEHQGVGAPAAQAHAAELTRLPVVFFLDLLLPANMVRYSFFFLTWAAGALGMYFLARYLLSEKTKKYIDPAAFLGSVFYLLNLATLQQYFDPLEMFAVHFATLPWFILIALRYLKESGKKNLIWFCAVTLLAAPMAHTATLFYVYFAAFSLFIATAFLLHRSKGFFKRGTLLVFLTITLNSFWLAPNIYYVVKEAGTVANSKISRTFSDEAYLQSRAFGDIKSLAILKNFPFNWREYDYSTNSFEDLMRVWNFHLAKPYVTEIGFGAVAFAVLGISVAFFKKSKLILSLLPVLAAGIFFWLVGIPKEFTLLREALRFPFTKFSILMICALSAFFAFSSQFVLNIFGKVKIAFVFVVFAVSALIYFMLPAFQGNFIDPAMKVKIPDKYFQAFEWFESADPSGRVAKLPLQTFWNWNYYDWGYQGGGFTWFGIPQPTLDREFDRWGLFNENFYWESSDALYRNDPDAFMAALKKYQVKYLLLDESTINAGGKPELLLIPELKEILLNSSHIKEAAKFGFLTIYETDFDNGRQFISVPLTHTENIKSYLLKGDLLSSIDLSVNRGFPEAYNCDIKKIGTVYKQNLPGAIIYAAEGGGVSCDYLNFPDLEYDKAYILHIEGENRQGRSLKIYFTNYKTGRADIEELLPNGKFDKEFYIYPGKLEGSGYSLNFETRSYGPIASENLITKVEIYETFSGSPSVETNIENDLKVSDVKKYGTWAYVVETEGSLPAGKGILMLGQGYEPGWKAFPLQFPIFKQELEHFKFNGWANAWEVDFDNRQLIIVYWPQLLEFGGIVVALVSILICFVRKN